MFTSVTSLSKRRTNFKSIYISTSYDVVASGAGYMRPVSLEQKRPWCHFFVLLKVIGGEDGGQGNFLLA